MEEQLPTTVTYKPKLLLVDDEESILNSLRRLLRGQPYEVLLATSGAQALEIMARQPIDLVMSDARMPNMDGSTLLAHIHQRYPDTLRIMLTGYADPSAIIKAINEGQIHRYISKPWHDEEMLLMLRQSLAYQHSERERLRLVQETWDRNEELKLLNATLEKNTSRPAPASCNRPPTCWTWPTKSSNAAMSPAPKCFRCWPTCACRPPNRPTGRSSNWCGCTANSMAWMKAPVVT